MKRKIAEKFLSWVKTSKNIKHKYPSSYEELLNLDILFLITPGRSGTKSFIKFFDENTDAYTLHDPVVTNSSVANLYYKNLVPNAAIPWIYYSSRQSYLLDTYTKKTIFIDGDCKSLPFFEELSTFFPKSKFVHLVRRPEKFIISGINRGYFLDKPSEFWGYLDSPDNSLNQYERIAWFWNEANIIAERLKLQVGDSRALTVKAEDMFASNKVILDAITNLDLRVNLSSDYIEEPLKVSNAQKMKSLKSLEFDKIEMAIKKYCTTKTNYYD